MSPTKTQKRCLAPIGDDIEPIEVSCEDVEIGEPLEAAVPRTREESLRIPRVIETRT